MRPRRLLEPSLNQMSPSGSRARPSGCRQLQLTCASSSFLPAGDTRSRPIASDICSVNAITVFSLPPSHRRICSGTRESGVPAAPGTAIRRQVASVHGLSEKIVMPSVVPGCASAGSMRAMAFATPSVTQTIPWLSTCTSPGPRTAAAAVPGGGGSAVVPPGGGKAGGWGLLRLSVVGVRRTTVSLLAIDTHMCPERSSAWCSGRTGPRPSERLCRRGPRSSEIAIAAWSPPCGSPIQSENASAASVPIGTDTVAPAATVTRSRTSVAKWPQARTPSGSTFARSWSWRTAEVWAAAGRVRLRGVVELADGEVVVDAVEVRDREGHPAPRRDPQRALGDVGLAVGELDAHVGARAVGGRLGERVARHHRADEVAVLGALGLRGVEEARVRRVERVEVVVELARRRLGRDVG